MHGLACSHVGMAIRPVLEKEEVPLIITVAQGPNLLNPHSKYMFRVFPPTNITGNLMAIFMNKYFPKKYTKVALLHTQEEYGSSGRDGLVSRLDKFGIKPLAIETHKIGDTDYSSQLLKIKGLNPEVLFILSYVKDMALITKQAHELGLNVVKIGYVGGNYAILRELAGKEALKDFYASTVLTDTFRSERLKSFMDLYKKEYPEYMKNPHNPSDSNVTAYVAMQLYAEALKRAGKDLTRTKFIQALEGIKNYDSRWLPPISFSPTQHEGILAKRYVRFEDGVPKIIDMDIKMD
jgi:branched-chain amino acid transport system substrate-binding protein